MDTGEELSKRIADSGLAECIRNGWPTIPLINEKQQLLQLHARFVEKIAASESAEELLQQVKRHGEHRVYKEITSMDQAFTIQSTAWYFSPDGLVKFKMPERLQLTKVDAIASFVIWYTGAHIETGGDDSITHYPIGKKMMIFAERGCQSRIVEPLLQNTKTLENFLLKGPRSAVSKMKIGFIGQHLHHVGCSLY